MSFPSWHLKPFQKNRTKPIMIVVKIWSRTVFLHGAHQTVQCTLGRIGCWKTCLISFHFSLWKCMDQRWLRLAGVKFITHVYQAEVFAYKLACLPFKIIIFVCLKFCSVATEIWLEWKFFAVISFHKALLSKNATALDSKVFIFTINIFKFSNFFFSVCLADSKRRPAIVIVAVSLTDIRKLLFQFAHQRVLHRTQQDNNFPLIYSFYFLEDHFNIWRKGFSCQLKASCSVCIWSNL